MTMDANFEGSSQQAKEDSINRRNGQGPKHLKFFLLVFLIFFSLVIFTAFFVLNMLLVMPFFDLAFYFESCVL